LQRGGAGLVVVVLDPDRHRVEAVVGVDVAEVEGLVRAECQRPGPGAVAEVDRGRPGVGPRVEERSRAGERAPSSRTASPPAPTVGATSRTVTARSPVSSPCSPGSPPGRRRDGQDEGGVVGGP
jgi:hypothetical protein